MSKVVFFVVVFFSFKTGLKFQESIVYIFLCWTLAYVQNSNFTSNFHEDRVAVLLPGSAVDVPENSISGSDFTV